MPAGPPRGTVIGELASVVQVPRLLVALPGLLRRRSAPRTVVVFPGRSVGDRSTFPLRWVLARRGHRVHPWGLGRNDGDAERLVPLAAEVVRRRADASGGPVVLVGQSMGGYYAREVARADPDRVAAVVTLGTPIFRRLSPGAITCPVVAVFSRADRVVGTSRSVDHDPATEMVEVRSLHMGMGIDPDALRVVIRAVQGAPG